MEVKNLFKSTVYLTTVSLSDGKALGVVSGSQGLSSYIWFNKQQALDFAEQLKQAALQLTDEPSQSP